MKEAADYCIHLRALIVGNSTITHWNVLRKETQGRMGLIRYRLTVADDSVLEMFERFEVADEQVHSFHRQDSHDRLRKRWDNAPHHPDVQTHPHHVHDGSEDSILAHQSVTAEEVLMYVTQALANQ